MTEVEIWLFMASRSLLVIEIFPPPEITLSASISELVKFKLLVPMLISPASPEPVAVTVIVESSRSTSEALRLIEPPVPEPLVELLISP